MISYTDAAHAMWNAGCLSYKLWDQQLPIYHAIRDLPPEVDEPVVLCSRQFGKSFMGVAMAVEDCLRFPDRSIMIVGPTYEQCRDIVVPRLERIIKDAPPGVVRRLKSEKRWYIGNSELIIGGFDVNSSSQRGKTLQNIYIEEVVDSSPDSYMESMRSDLGPALTHSDAGKMIFLTTPPKIPDHPFITETMAKAELSGCLYIYTIYDNTALTPAQFEACVRRAGGVHTDDWKREYLCQVIRDRSIVLAPDFDQLLHVRDFEIPSPVNLEVYADWGGVRDFTAAYLVGHDFLQAKDLWIDEIWWPHNTSTKKITDDLKERWLSQYDVKSIVVDASGQIQVDISQTHGIEIRTPTKEDWEANINVAANRFTTNKVLIHPRCELLVQTCRSGTFNKNRTDFSRSNTLGHMDAFAAFMYGTRHIDRSSPYTAGNYPSQTQWIPPTINKTAPILPKQGFTQVERKVFGNGTRRKM